MCMAEPMRVIASTGLVARCAAEGREATVDLSLVGPQPDGRWVLVLLGVAREPLDDETAELIRKARAGLAAALAGGDVGDAFADLEAREPALPPHLEAARCAAAARG
jgi:hydrogenase expression/formation protein HypC